MTVYLQYIAVIHQVSQQHTADKQHFPTAPLPDISIIAAADDADHT